MLGADQNCSCYGATTRQAPLEETVALERLIDQAGVSEWSGQDRAGAAPSTGSLGRYTILGALGEGGMGQVLRVRDRILGREVAAKVIRREAGPQQTARFVREAQVTGHLQHPNIVAMHELGMTEEGQLYFTMKAVEGQDLAARLDEERSGAAPKQSLASNLQLFLKVCDALSYAHSRNVVHRDLKPSNIMVGQFREVQVMDWGLARLIGQPDAVAARDGDGADPSSLVAPAGADRPLRTLAGAVLGTPSYMSPEQARGEIGRIDRRSDIYSLGAILYELLTLQPPFSGETLIEVVQQVAFGALVPPSARGCEREIPHELEVVVLKAMSRRVRDRYEQVEQLRSEIAAYLEGRVLQAVDYSGWQVLQKWVGRNRPAVAALLVGVASVLAALGGISWQLGEARRARDGERVQRMAAEAATRRAVASLREQERLRAAEHEGRIALEQSRKRGEQKERMARVGQLVGEAAALYRSRADPGHISARLAEAQRLVADHPALLRLQGRMALDRQQWGRSKALLERVVEHIPEDYQAHFLLYRWYQEQGQSVSLAAQVHVEKAARYGALDTAIGLMSRGHRVFQEAVRLSGQAKTDALQRALAMAVRALKKDPGFWWALTLRAWCYGELGQHQRGLADLSEVLLRTKSPWAYINRANAYRKMGRFEPALADYGAALRINAEKVAAWFGRGGLHFDRRNFKQALADFTEAIRLSPRDARCHHMRAEAYAALGQHASALRDFDAALGLDATSFKSYFGRGRLYLSLERFAEARSDLDRAVRLAPGSTAAHFHRGYLHSVLREYDAALRDFSAVIRIDPKHARAYGNRGEILRRLKRHEQALADLARAVRLEPGKANSYHTRGLILMTLGRKAEALSDFGTVIRLNPRHRGAYSKRGELLTDMRRYDEALADLDRAIRLDPRRAEAYVLRGRLQDRRKQPGKALADYSAAIRLDARHKLAYTLRGVVHAEQKRHAQALADFESALRLDPGFATALINRGCLYRLQKRYRLAIADWERALPLTRATPWEQRVRAFLREARGQLK